MLDEMSIMINPTYRSNWVIRDVLCVGACPNKAELQVLVAEGFTSFISLQTPHEIETYKCGYTVSAKKYSFPINDGCVPSDRDAFRWAHMIWDMLCRGERVYMHCYGGHGRAGLMASLVLQIAGMSVDEALNTVQTLHDTRVKTGNVASPTTTSQVSMVERFMSEFEPNVSLFLSGSIAELEKERLPVNTRYVEVYEDPWIVLDADTIHSSAFTRIIVS